MSPTNIFEVQTEIAHAITTAMKTALTDQDAAQLALIPTENMAAYRAYHRAMEIADKVSTWQDPEYREALEEAVALDPTFTRAWAELVGNLSFANFFFEIDSEADSISRAEEAIETIRILAPNSADYLIAQAYYSYYALKDYDLAYQFIAQAQDMMPSDSRILELKIWIQRRQGDFSGRIETIRQFLLLDPRNESYAGSLIFTLITNHRYDDAQEEVDNTPFDTDWIKYSSHLLMLRDNGDFSAWTEFNANFQLQSDDTTPLDIWDAQIQNRDYEAAISVFERLDGPQEFAELNVPYVSDRHVAQVITYWLQQDDERLAETMSLVRAQVAERQNPDGSFDHYFSNLDNALVSAIDGRAQEAELFVRRFLRAARDTDLASLTERWDRACQTLAMAGATTATVNCLRDGFVEPSYIYPFLEPHLPYYDAIRDEAEFVELLAEISASTQ